MLPIVAAVAAVVVAGGLEVIAAKFKRQNKKVCIFLHPLNSKFYYATFVVRGSEVTLFEVVI